MARSALFVLAFTLAACQGDKDEIVYSEDIRVDAADDANNPDSFGTRMCVTSAGVVYILWLDSRADDDEESVDIWMNRSVSMGSEGSWLPAAVKVNQGEGNVWNPDLYCNEIGAFVAWEDDRDGLLENHQIYFNRTTDQGESFMPDDMLLEIDPDGMSMSLEPKIVGTGQDLFVVWYDSLNGAYDILLGSSGDAGETWRDPVRVDSDDPAGSAYSARPKVAVSDNAQDVWVVWEDSRDGKADTYFARSDTGGITFKEDERIDGGDDVGQNDSFEPQICADTQGYLYAVWHDARNGEGRDIFFNYSDDKGSDWLANAVRLDSDNAGFSNSLYPVCVSDENTAHVAWQDNRAEGYDVFYREITDGIPGTDEVRLDVGNPEGFANSLDTRIAIDAGNVVVAWGDGRAEAEAGTDNGYNDLYNNFSRDGGPFDAETDYRMDSMYDGQSFKVDLSLAVLGGQWYAAWTDGRGGTSDIYFQRLEIGVESEPPPLEDPTLQTAP